MPPIRDSHFQIIAHRGASGLAPENTLAAIREALRLRVDGIEIDVHLSRDGDVMVIHDPTVDRTTNGSGRINEMTANKLQQLDAGSWFASRFAGERIPLLREVLEMIDGKCRLLIEIKKEGRDNAGIEKRVLDLLQSPGSREWCVVQSFNDSVLQQLEKLDPLVETYKLMVGKVPWLPFYFDQTMRFGSLANYRHQRAINPFQRFASRHLINALHRRGFTTFVWTVDDPGVAQRVKDRGADGIITNHPERFA